jgi:hypothetical protein
LPFRHTWQQEWKDRLAKLLGMENRADTLPTIEELEQKNAKLEQQNVELATKLKWYEEQFRLAQQKRFGASSEKTHPDQLTLNLFKKLRC